MRGTINVLLTAIVMTVSNFGRSIHCKKLLRSELLLHFSHILLL